MDYKALPDTAFLILTALADGPRHGYGIITDAAQISGARVTLRTGTLYAALDRLSGDGLIEDDREEIVNGRLRRYYRLTPAGRERLAAETARLQARAAAAAARLKRAARVRPAPAPKPAGGPAYGGPGLARGRNQAGGQGLPGELA